ncbi:universal stress protein [Dyadobacter arcticus]|uniref:Nucleotide-binding universal stress UspA family protein n=1 Tax=Dyadobacter arcticus TaxID=1078754 RepID=A0ABX0ULR5_9BACT|nr:universal stress protein [Dyadobacter arcticus]NIJ52575.1 nucleotide-binding universal stress UspA family protein [Dyadobacter arcticus]
MKKILVTTDFSAGSKAGLRFAIQLASQSKFALTFFHSYNVLSPTGWTAAKIKEYKKSESANVQQQLDLFVEKIYQELEIQPEHHQCVIKGSVFTESNILKYAAEQHFDFICISTRGAGRLQRLLGTNTANLINNSEIPVIAVPHTYKSKKITSILYASDLTNLDKELEIVAAFAKPLDAEVQLLHFTTFLETHIDPKKIEQATKKSDHLQLKLDIKFFEPSESLVSHIEAAIIRTKPSMLVMFTEHHRNLFEKIFLSSKSAEYSYHPTVPLLVFGKN